MPGTKRRTVTPCTGIIQYHYAHSHEGGQLLNIERPRPFGVHLPHVLLRLREEALLADIPFFGDNGKLVYVLLIWLHLAACMIWIGFGRCVLAFVAVPHFLISIYFYMYV